MNNKFKFNQIECMIKITIDRFRFEKEFHISFLILQNVDNLWMKKNRPCKTQ